MGKCKVVDTKKENNTIMLEVDGCNLRTAGGGQPSDRGTIIKGKQKANIIEVLKINGRKLLKVDKDIQIKEGDVVEYNLDEEYRRILSRMHTGEHILSKALELTIPGLKIEKAELKEDISTIFVKSPKEISWGELFEAERTANRIIEEDRKVNIHITSKKDAKNIEGLRIKWDRVPEDRIRIVEIEGYDAIACSGTHTANTKEVGKIIITKFTGGRESYEVKFQLDAEPKLWEYGYRIRSLESEINMKIEELYMLHEKVKKENKQLQKEIKTISNYLTFPEEKLIINNMLFWIVTLKNFPSQAISIYLSKMYKQKEKNHIIINETNKETNICLSLPLLSHEESQNLVEYLIRSVNAKGGGKGIYKLVTATVKTEEVLKKIKEFKK